MSPHRPALFLPLLVLGGCAAPIPGLYDLQTIDDEPLPAFFMESEIIAAEIQLNEDGTCLITSTERGEDGEVGSGTDEKCTWVESEDGITVTDSNAPLAGSVDGDAMTLNLYGAVFALTRR